MSTPIQSFLAVQDALVLDGGLATELEARGCDLGNELWSASLLRDDPGMIRQVHADYLAAGADLVISASYQATIPGFMAQGMTQAQAVELLRLSVELALQARDAFWADEKNRVGRLRPLVAASIGPYGAYLADGSEYRGDYELDEAGLIEWHRPRWHVLARSGADLLACETVPSYSEARALKYLLRETPEVQAWFSFSCRDGKHISDGTPIAQCAKTVTDEGQVVAIGINCTSPRFVPSLIAELRQTTQKPIVVYPNSGEQYDAENRRWLGLSDAAEFGTLSREWRREGAALIGGCCRTGPAHIQQIADRMRRHRG
jgi:homocysteine S-methyltransferase